MTQGGWRVGTTDDLCDMASVPNGWIWIALCLHVDAEERLPQWRDDIIRKPQQREKERSWRERAMDCTAN